MMHDNQDNQKNHSLISRLIHSLGLAALFGRRDLDCSEVRAASSDFIDGDLGQAESSRIRSHLERCGPCAAFVRTLRATIDMLGSTAPSPAPAGFRERVYERIRGS